MIEVPQTYRVVYDVVVLGDTPQQAAEAAREHLDRMNGAGTYNVWPHDPDTGRDIGQRVDIALDAHH